MNIFGNIATQDRKASIREYIDGFYPELWASKLFWYLAYMGYSKPGGNDSILVFPCLGPCDYYNDPYLYLNCIATHWLGRFPVHREVDCSGSTALFSEVFTNKLIYSELHNQIEASFKNLISNFIKNYDHNEHKKMLFEREDMINYHFAKLSRSDYDAINMLCRNEVKVGMYGYDIKNKVGSEARGVVFKCDHSHNRCYAIYALIDVSDEYKQKYRNNYFNSYFFGLNESLYIRYEHKLVRDMWSNNPPYRLHQHVEGWYEYNKRTVHG